MEGYLDLLMGLNFLVDHMLLMGANRLAGFPCGSRRAALAAALGAVHSGGCLLPDFRFLGSLFWRLICLSLMAGIAFGWSRSALRRGGTFVLMSLAVGGLAVSLNRTDVPGLLLCGGIVWLLCWFSAGSQPDEVPLQIRYGDAAVRLLALRDTGNTLRDPVTGEQILVISADAASRLTGLTREQIQNPLQTMVQHPLPGLRLIPYHTVGQPAGLLLAMAFDDVTIGPRKRRATVAFDTGGLGHGGVYQALTGGNI